MVRLTITDGIARLTLADPASANALGETMVHALEGAFDTIDRDRDVPVVMTGGARPFRPRATRC